MKITVERDSEGEENERTIVHERVFQFVLVGTKKTHIESEEPVRHVCGDHSVLVGKMAEMAAILDRQDVEALTAMCTELLERTRHRDESSD